MNNKMPCESVLKFYNWKTLCFLGVVAVALSSFAPLSFLAPIPLAFSSLMFGRKKGLILGASCLVILLGINITSGIFSSVIGLFLISLFNSSIISEVILRDIDPSRGLLLGGILILILVFSFMAFYYFFGSNTLENLLKNNLFMVVESMKKSGQGEEAKVLQDFVKNPDVFIKDIMNWMPAAAFFSVFIGLWIGMLGVLRNSSIWMRTRKYSFSVRHIVRFRAPAYLIWPLVASLVLILTGEYLFGKSGEIMGLNLLYCVGVFYFIQGIGIYFDFLTNAGIKGIVRSLLMFFAVIFANRFFALLGLFDMWANFRKYFNKMNK